MRKDGGGEAHVVLGQHGPGGRGVYLNYKWDSRIRVTKDGGCAGRTFEKLEGFVGIGLQDRDLGLPHSMEVRGAVSWNVYRSWQILGIAAVPSLSVEVATPEWH